MVSHDLGMHVVVLYVLACIRRALFAFSSWHWFLLKFFTRSPTALFLNLVCLRASGDINAVLSQIFSWNLESIDRIDTSYVFLVSLLVSRLIGIDTRLFEYMFECISRPICILYRPNNYLLIVIVWIVIMIIVVIVIIVNMFIYWSYLLWLPRNGEWISEIGLWFKLILLGPM